MKYKVKIYYEGAEDVLVDAKTPEEAVEEAQRLFTEDAPAYEHIVSTSHAIQTSSDTKTSPVKSSAEIASRNEMSSIDDFLGSGCAGYEVVCPDGLFRHYPYHNRGDAESHAEIASDPNHPEHYEGSCRIAPKMAPAELEKPPCPGGLHTVRPIMMAH